MRRKQRQQELRAARAGRVGPCGELLTLQASAPRGRCGRIVAALAADLRRPDARAAAVAHPACHRVWEQRLRATDSDAGVRWAPPPGAAVVAMARDHQELVRRVAAGSADCPEPVLRLLASDPDRRVRAAAAANPACPTLMLAAFAEDHDPALRVAAAANPSCPGWVLAGLVTDADADVVAAVAANEACPAASLAVLASYDSSLVRWVLAENPSTAPETLREIASTSFEAAESLSANPSCPFDLLEDLAFSRCTHVHDPCDGDACRWESEDRSKVLAGVLAHPRSARDGGWLRGHIEETLASNGGDAGAQIASVAAETSAEFLALWVDHEDEDVRRELASNRHADAATLAALRDDLGDGVQSRLAQNPSCPPEVLASLSEEEFLLWELAHNPASPPLALEAVMSSDRPELGPVVAAHRNISPRIVEALAADSDQDMRAALAANPACPWETSARLCADDPSTRMREALARRALHPGQPP